MANFNLVKSTATTLDDNPAQKLEYTYADKDMPVLDFKDLSIFAIQDNILYHIGYESRISSTYYEHIPIVQRMIDSFEMKTNEIPMGEVL